MGPVAPVALNWAEFVEALIHAKPEERVPEAEAEQEQVEFRPDPEPLVSPDALRSAHAVLAQVPLPTRLSTLLAACPGPTVGAAAGSDVGAGPADLLVAATLRAFDNSARDHEPATEPGDWALAGAGGSQHSSGGAPRVNDWARDGASDVAGAGRASGRGVHLLDVLGPDTACLADGERLDCGALRGDDLIVCVDRDQADAILLGDLSAPAPTPIPKYFIEAYASTTAGTTARADQVQRADEGDLL